MAGADTPVGPLRILVLEDVPSDAELEIRELRRDCLVADWMRVETERNFRAALEEYRPDVVLAVSHALGRSVVAEMIERGPVAEVLRDLGGEYGQGWFWGRPEPIEGDEEPG